jgi:hypothetical protein
MTSPNLNTMTQAELTPLALDSAYWLEDHGYVIADLIAIREQDPELRKAIILARTLLESKVLHEREKKAGMKDMFGAEA